MLCISYLCNPFSASRGRKASDGDRDGALARAAKILGVSVHTLSGLAPLSVDDNGSVIPSPERADNLRAAATLLETMADAVESGDDDNVAFACVEWIRSGLLSVEKGPDGELFEKLASRVQREGEGKLLSESIE